MAAALGLGLFDEMADVLRTLLPPELGEVRMRPRRYGIKVWFDAAAPPREHYEAQVIGARHVEGASVLGLEVGFHAEHPRQEQNDAILAHVLAAEAAWRPVLGAEAVAGPFLGRPDDWRRISETWPDPDLGDPELPFELAARLTDYVTAIEPLRRASDEVPQDQHRRRAR
jgi:hypothetical protein